MVEQYTNDFEFTFFMPSNGKAGKLGGAQLLFLSIAEYIAREYDITVNFIDELNGRISERITNKKINLIDYKRFDENHKFNIAGKHIIICPLSNIRNAISFFEYNKDYRFFFWNLGTSDFNNNFSFMRIYNQVPLKYRRLIISVFEKSTKRKLELLMSLMIRKRAVAFMSGKNLEFLRKHILIPSEPILLPVSIKENEVVFQNLSERRRNYIHNEVNIAWLGRFAKSITINKIIDSLAHSKHRIIFHIIGWGTQHEIDMFTSLAKRRNVQIKVLENLYEDKLDNYLIDNIDLGIAMGLSLFNFARLKIPVVATEYFNSKFDIKGVLKYKWFFNLDNFDLATSISISNDFRDLHKIDFIIDNIIDDYDSFADQCYSFYSKKFLFPTVVRSFINVAKGSLLRGIDLKEMKSLVNDDLYSFIHTRRIY